jgi:hypothetical protein
MTMADREQRKRALVTAGVLVAMVVAIYAVVMLKFMR